MYVGEVRNICSCLSQLQVYTEEGGGLKNHYNGFTCFSPFTTTCSLLAIFFLPGSLWYPFILEGYENKLGSSKVGFDLYISIVQITTRSVFWVLFLSECKMVRE